VAKEAFRRVKCKTFTTRDISSPRIEKIKSSIKYIGGAMHLVRNGEIPGVSFASRCTYD
jgi:hypothetical protein